MKLAALLNNRYAEIENRKRVLKQKTADEAYKKNAQYFQPMSNPALDDLVDLLTGKKEQKAKPALQQAIRQLQEEHVETPTYALIEDVVAASNDETTVDIFKRVQQSALSSEIPTTQDLAVAESAAAYIAQKTQASTQSDIETAIEKTVDNDKQPQEKQNLGQVVRNRLFARAAASYQFQAQMARSGFHFDEPVFYQSA
jgi:hypothetical protein